jgi:hypothetical protein
LIYLSGCALGYSNKGATFAALAYGLGSLGWPYALSLYREPLVGLLWSAGLFGIIAWRYHKRWWLGILGIILVSATPFIKTTAVFGIPFLLLAILERTQRSPKAIYRTVAISFFVLIVLILCFQLLFAWRYGKMWDWSYLANLDGGLVLQRIYGQLISPVKGILFYTPFVVVAATAIYLIWRKHRLIAVS